VSEQPENTVNVDPDAALAALRTIPEHFDPALLVIAWKRDEPPEVAAARPTDRLAAALREVVLGHAGDWSQRELVDYGPATDATDGQVMWLPVSRVPLLADAGTDVDLADLPLFDPGAGYASRLRLSAIRGDTDAGPAVLYRALRPAQVIARSDKIPILRRGDRMDLVGRPTVLIDRGVDAIVVGGVVLFTNRRGFERVFGFLEELRANATLTFDAVTSTLNIDGIDEMRVAATGSPAMLGKMASIERKLREYPAYRDAITMSRLVEFVRRHPHTEVEVRGRDADARLVFQSDPQHRFKILKLLDDDYLQSQLTHLDYEANSKGLPLT